MAGVIAENPGNSTPLAETMLARARAIMNDGTNDREAAK